MDNKKYNTIYQSRERTSFNNIQVLLEDVALIRDKNNGKLYARCIYKNLCEKKIKAVAVKITCYDESGKKENVIEYNYLDLMVGENKSFGQQTPIEITNTFTNRIDVIIDKIMYENGDIAFFDGNVTVEKNAMIQSRISNEDKAVLETGAKEEIKKKKKLKRIIISFSVILLFVLITVGVGFYFTNRAYNKPINEIVSLLNENYVDEDKYEVCFDFEEVVKYNKIYDSVYLEENTFMAEKIHWLKDNFGDDYKISVNVASATEIEDSEISRYKSVYDRTLQWYKDSRELKFSEFTSKYNNKMLSTSKYEDIKNAYDDVVSAYSNVDITKGYEVDLVFEIKGNKEAEVEMKNIIILEINEKWYIYEYNLETFMDHFISRIGEG